MRLRHLLLICVSSVAALAVAELPPAAYKAMQGKAPEFLGIEAKSVKTSTKAKGADKVTTVTVTAAVKVVRRSKMHLHTGDLISIKYTIIEHTPPFAGPSSVPVLKNGQTCPAYLKHDKGNVYEPAAGGYSFETMK